MRQNSWKWSIHLTQVATISYAKSSSTRSLSGRIGLILSEVDTPFFVEFDEHHRLETQRLK